jgi:hypothetical protein
MMPAMLSHGRSKIFEETDPLASKSLDHSRGA